MLSKLVTYTLLNGVAVTVPFGWLTAAMFILSDTGVIPV